MGFDNTGLHRCGGFRDQQRFNTLPHALEMQGGNFDHPSRYFTFSAEGFRTVVAFSTPDRFSVVTKDSRGRIIEYYQFTLL